MALTMRVIGPPSAGILAGFDFFPGEDRVLSLQLYELDDDDSWPIPEGAVCQLELPGAPDDVIKADDDITVDAEDPSIFSVSLSDEDTTILISGDIRFSYTIEGITRIAVLEQALKKLTSAL